MKCLFHLNLSLLTKFSIIAFLITAAIAIALAWGIQWRMEQSALREEAENAAVQVSALLNPNLKASDFTDPLSSDRFAQIDALIRENILQERSIHGHIVRIKIWNREGVLIYSDEKDLLGLRFPENEEFKEALSGKIAMEISSLKKEENIGERGRFARLMEVYVSLRPVGSPHIMGVFEIYHDLTFLENHIAQTRRFIYSNVGLGFLILYGSLFLLVRNASRQLIRRNDENVHLYEEVKQQLAERKAAEEKYRAIFENAVEGIFLTTPDGHYLNINPALAKMHGYDSPEELIKNITDTQHQIYVDSDRREEFKSLLKTQGEAKGFVTQFYRKDGSNFWASINARAIRDDSGTLRFYEGIIEDITERKRAEEQLLNAARQWRTTFDGISDMVCLLDPEGKILRCNNAMAGLLKKPFLEIIGRAHWEIVYGTTAPIQECPVMRMRETNRRQTAILPINDRWFNIAVDPLFDETGGLIGAVHIMSDITEHKRAEEALRESEDRYRDLVEFSQHLICTHDLRGQILSVNQDGAKLLGYDQRALLNKNIGDLLAPEVRDEFDTYLDTIRKQGVAKGLMLLQTAAGEKRIWEYNNTLRTEGVTAPIVRAIAHDVTERVLAEKAVERLSQENAIMAEIGRIISSTLNIEEVYEPFAEEVKKLIPFDRIVINIINIEKSTVSNVYMAGKGIADRKVGEIYPLEGSGNVEMVRTKSSLLIQTEDFNEYKDRFPMLLSTFQVGFRSIMNVPLFSKGRIIGGLLLRSLKPYAYTDKDVRLAERVGNQIAGAIANAQLFIEGKRVEETLRQSEEKYRTILKNIQDGYLEVDLAGNFTFVNDAECRNLGYTREELIGMNNRQYTDETTGRKLYQTFNGVYRTGEPVKVLDVEVIRKDGTKAFNEISVSLIRDSEGKPIGFRGIARDVTERKRAEIEMVTLQEQLRQSQKMEAIGQLAGGVAHDFNNLLTVIHGYSELILTSLDENSRLRQDVQEIIHASERASSLTRQLLAFSRKQVLQPKVLDLNAHVFDMDKMLRRMIGENIELMTLLAKDLGRIKADPGQIEQVILNLAVNARDAMLNGGKLTIETANIELDENYARSHIGVTPGHYVMLSVSDTGVGIAREVKERIFEPFFTTKEKGKGTGLGLSTVFGIIQQSGGNIWVYSEPDLGTTFKIYLPRIEEDAESLKPSAVSTKSLQGSETILLVEDEEIVRKLACTILQKNGYKVLEAPNGEEALRIVQEQNGNPIHLLVTDVVMPGMSGRQLADRVERLRPEMKILYISGYTDNAIVHHGVLEKGIDYIQKPFTIEGLARKVREVLDK
jgi:PAS domain S-box-containing protein